MSNNELRRPLSGLEIGDTLHESGAIPSFVKRARQRSILMLLLDQAALAATAGLLGTMVLLVAGTQFLDWYWPLLMFGAAFAIGLFRLRRRLPSLYAVAQQVDARLGLHDSLSTALHFQSADRELAGAQRDQAERILSGLRLEHAVPFRTPQSAYFCAAGVLAASMLFAVRFGLTSSLSLQKPIADIRWNPVQPSQRTERLASRKSAIQERLDQQIAEMGMSLEKIDSPPGDLTETTDKAMPAFATPDGKAPVAAPEKNVSGGEKTPSETGDSEGGEDSANGSEQSKEESGAEGQPPNPGKQQQNQNASKNGNGSQGDNSLGSKLKDALNQLLAKMKPSSGQGGEQKQQASQEGQQGKQQAQNSKGQQGQQGKSGEGQPPKDSQNAQNGEGGEQSQTAQSKPGDRNADKSGSDDANSGVGKTDGAKEIREAEQLAAMGKISELIGKRSQQLTGEMTVEVSSGNQQLKTGYTQKAGQHADLGAAIARDEIPLQYQPYIQKYFEEVRKLKR